MTVVVQDNVIEIDGAGRVEDAEVLVVAVQNEPRGKVDLSGCTDLHAAVLQVLLVFRPEIIGLKENLALAEWLSPLLDG